VDVAVAAAAVLSPCLHSLVHLPDILLTIPSVSLAATRSRRHRPENQGAAEDEHARNLKRDSLHASPKRVHAPRTLPPPRRTTVSASLDHSRRPQTLPVSFRLVGVARVPFRCASLFRRGGRPRGSTDTVPIGCLREIWASPSRIRPDLLS
jgi:hypothetical protein